jgi:hypothetical protein
MLILGGPAILSSSSRTPEISLAGRAADGESLPVLSRNAAAHTVAGLLDFARYIDYRRRAAEGSMAACRGQTYSAACPPMTSCGGHRSVIAVVTDPTRARTVLVALDLPHEPAFAPARDPPQVELEWDDPT